MYKTKVLTKRTCIQRTNTSLFNNYEGQVMPTPSGYLKPMPTLRRGCWRAVTSWWHSDTCFSILLLNKQPGKKTTWISVGTIRRPHAGFHHWVSVSFLFDVCKGSVDTLIIVIDFLMRFPHIVGLSNISPSSYFLYCGGAYQRAVPRVPLLLTKFSLYALKGGIKPHTVHFFSSSSEHRTEIFGQRRFYNVVYRRL